MFTDTHAHLADQQFAADLPDVIARAQAAGVTRIVSIAADPDSVARTFDICRQHPQVRMAVGLHPEVAANVPLCAVNDIREHAAQPAVVAIGEIGLDYYREAKADLGLRQKQKDLLWAQLELARELRKPVVIHNRDSDADLLEILRAHAAGLPKDWRPWGVMHCFGGGERFGFDCLEIGLLLSYTGILTFKNARSLRETAAKIPLDHVMLETDCPYLAPQPHRGQRNEPDYIPLIAQTLAEVQGVSVAEIARVTSANTDRLFGC